MLACYEFTIDSHGFTGSKKIEKLTYSRHML